MDGALNNSETLSTLMSDYTSGSSSLTHDLKEILSRPALDASAIQSLTLSGTV